MYMVTNHLCYYTLSELYLNQEVSHAPNSNDPPRMNLEITMHVYHPLPSFSTQPEQHKPWYLFYQQPSI